MQSGCPHSQGGSHPEFQQWSNTGALQSPHVSNVTPQLVNHLTNEKQNIMVAIPGSTELIVAYSPLCCQRGYAPSTQNMAFQQSERALMQINHDQINRKVNDFHSSACVPVQRKSYFGTSANVNTARQSIDKSGQQNEHPNHNFSRHSIKGSYCNKSEGPQQRNDASLASTSSAVHQGDRLEVPTSSSQQCSSVSQNSSPILRASLEERNLTDFDIAFPNFASKKSNSNTGLTTVHSSKQKHSKSQDKRSSVGQTEIVTVEQIKDFISKKLEYLEGLTLSNKRETVSANEQAFQSNSAMPKGADLLSTVSVKDVKKHHTNCVVGEQYGATVGQKPEEDCSKNSEAMADCIPKSKDCTALTLDKLSTGTLLSAMKNSNNAPKNNYVEKSASVNCDLPVKKHLDVISAVYDDEGLVYSEGCCQDKTIVSSNDESFNRRQWCDKTIQDVSTIHYTLTALEELITSLENVESIAEMDNFSELILQQYWNGDKDNLRLFVSTEYPHIMTNVAAACTKNEDERPVVLTAVSRIPLDELTKRHPSSKANCSSLQKEWKSIWFDQEPDVSEAPKQITAKEKGFTGLELEEIVCLGRVQDVFEDSIPESSFRTSELISLIDNQDANTKKQKSTEDPRHCSFAARQSEQCSTGSVCSPKDLSITHSEDKGTEKVTPSESEGQEVLSQKIVPQYEDISDDDVSQLEPSFTTPQYEDVSEDENGKQLVVLLEDQTDDDDDDDDYDDDYDDYLVIPISMSGLEAGPKGDCNGENGDDERLLPVPKPVPASAFSQLEVFDTIESFQKAVVQVRHCFDVGPCMSPPEHEMDTEGEPNTPPRGNESYSESEDSCETEDSCDYSSGSEQNYLTVSRQCLERLAPLPLERSHSPSETKTNTEPQNNQTSSSVELNCIKKQLIETNDVIILSSNTDDSDSEHKYKKAKRKRLDLPGLADSVDGPSVQKKRRSHEPVGIQFGTVNGQPQKTRRSPAETIRQKKSKATAVFHGSEKVAEKENACKKKVKKNNSNDLFATQSAPETPERLPEKQRLSVDQEDCSSLPNPGLAPLIVEESSTPSRHLKLVKESRVHHKKKHDDSHPKNPTETSKKNDSRDTNKSVLYRNKKGQFSSKPKDEKKNDSQANITKPKLISRQLSLPCQEGPSTSASTLFTTSERVSEAKRNSASSKDWSASEAASASTTPLNSKQNTPIARQLQRSHSYSNPSTSAKSHLPSPNSYSSAKNARQQVTEDWTNGFFPTRKDRKYSQRIEDCDSQREARQRPSHYERIPRHHPPKALMKKSIYEATEWTNHIRRKTPMEPRRIRDGYKWSEKPRKGSDRKQRCRYSPRPHQ